jgi:transcriptional regulator with XRE-family HTH domain
VTGDEPAETWEARFGRLVKAAREAAGVTQSRLERDAGLTPTAVTRLERGEYDLPVSELADLADALGVDPGSLFPPLPGGNGEPD